MPAIVTNQLRIKASDFFENNIDSTPTYVFIGGTSPWEEESRPPDVGDTTVDRIFALEEFIGMKRVQTADIISVIPRRDWVSQTVYDEYTDTDNVIDNKNPTTEDFYKFYILTDEFNVYKCISNNNRSQSTVKPTGTTISSFQTPDGYIWKYMYTIRAPDATKFMTPNWMPCYTLYSNDDSSQWLVQEAAVDGTIDNIVITNTGANYNSLNQPTITIEGDGTGASAIAQIDDESGTIQRILVTSSGSGYSYADVRVTNPTGSGIGATARAVLSPYGGHGKDARLELGATYKMIRSVFEGDESNILPTGIEYRKAGILLAPRSNEDGVALCVSNVNLYNVGETVEGKTSLSTGVIKTIDQIKNYIYLENVNGVFTQGEDISSKEYNTTNVIQVYDPVDQLITDTVVNAQGYKKNSGELLYFSSREKVVRGANQTEEIRFIISF